MDRLMVMASKWNLEVLKEPKGFIKLLQFVLAIFAFATTTSVSTSVGLTLECVNNTSPAMVLNFPVAYPFNTKGTHEYDVSACTGGKVVKPVTLCCDYGGKSEFYVAIGVLVWLYVIAALVIYIAFDESVYMRYEQAPTVDFIISCVIAMFWLVASSVWADGLRRMKIFSTSKELATVGVLEPYCSETLCHDYVTGVYNVLNVSIIFGFLNCAVWGASLWFLYKDTHWFKGGEDLPSLPVTSNPTGTDPVFPSTDNREYNNY